jgi:16S rRNA processing protein RimM
VVGLVRGFRGVRGAVRVEVLTDDPARFTLGSVLHPEGSDERLTVAEVHADKPGIVVRFAEVPTRNAAEALRDTYLEADPVDLPPDTYYWHEVVGCRVETTTGEELGMVGDVTRVGEAEVYLVRGARGELLVPAVRSVVMELAPADRRIVVDAVALGLDEG